MTARTARIERKTKETEIVVEVNLDGTGTAAIDTPLPFLSHMLDQIARHGAIDLTVKAVGDVDIDGHHTTEDIGIVLGEAVKQALFDRRGERVGGRWALLLDQSLDELPEPGRAALAQLQHWLRLTEALPPQPAT